MKAKVVWLIAHTNKDGSGVAQARFFLAHKSAAIKAFEIIYPSRVITAIGIKGKENG